MSAPGFRSALAGLAMTALFASCASSRFQDGFSYRPAHQGPDMSSVEETATIAPPTQKEYAAPVGEPNPPVPASASLSASQEELMKEMVQTGLTAQAEQGEKPDFRTTVRKIAGSYAEKNATTLSEKQYRKLDRLAAKMEKKQLKKQGPNVSWGPSNNLEWAILGAAAVGLFVGIFGIGFGWAIFLIAALAYLYFKLLHNN